MATTRIAALAGNTARGISPGIVALALSGAIGAPACAQTLGFVDDFSSPGTNGWTSLNANTNPGTGGVGGVGDGFLMISQLPNPFNFGSHNDGPNYAGDWTAAGITQVSFYLNDVNTDETFSFHFLVTGFESGPGGETTFQYNLGIDPPNGAWQQYSIDFATPGDWTRVHGEASLSDVLADIADAHFRHDLEPYVMSPNPIAGDIGIDNIALVPAPGVLSLLAGAAGVRRRARV